MASIIAPLESMFNALLQLGVVGFVGWAIICHVILWPYLLLTGAVLILLAWRAIHNLSTPPET